MTHASRRAGLAFVAVLGGGVLVTSVLACSDGSSSPGSASSSSSSGGTCPNDVPRECPASPPTFAKDVAPVIESSCAICHRPGGENPNRLLTTYDQIYAQRGAVLSQVASCRMPPPDAGVLSDDGRKVLLAWLVCSAPND